KKERILEKLRETEIVLDQYTSSWEGYSCKKAIEFSEFCYTASNDAFNTIEKILGVDYDERHHSATA
ncbi:MAG: hypothetical protein PF495_20075, partial [Spirochaetales bacterium]|nr:hypothetical protein [Spirochaetales bacterium]